MNKLTNLIITFFFILLCFNISYSQDEPDPDLNITMEEWQKRMDDLTMRKNYATGKISDNMKENDKLNMKLKDLNILIEKIDSEILKMLDTDKDGLYEFNNRFESTEKKILDESASLNDIKEYWFEWIKSSKIRLLEKYRKRYERMSEKLQSWKGE